jgi:hypothetical protein
VTELWTALLWMAYQLMNPLCVVPSKYAGRYQIS